MAENNEKSIHADHRKRMRERVRQSGLESLAEHEALEYMLFDSIPRQNTNPLAHRLIEHFGNFCNVLEASEEELTKVDGIGPKSAQQLHAHLDIFRYYALHKRRKRPNLKSATAKIQYVEPLFLGLGNEVMYLIVMDEKYEPLRDIKVVEGTPNQLRADISKMARAAVAAGATCAVLAHNHPHGLAIPSNADFTTTGIVARALGVLGIDLLDHIIVADDGSISMQSTGRMPCYDAITGEIQWK